MPILHKKYKGPEVSKKYIDTLYRELDLNCKYLRKQDINGNIFVNQYTDVCINYISIFCNWIN